LSEEDSPDLTQDILSAESEIIEEEANPTQQTPTTSPTEARPNLNEEDNTIEIDDDFRNMLLSEIAKGNSPRSKPKFTHIEYGTEIGDISFDGSMPGVQFGKVDSLEDVFAEKEVS